MRTAIFVYQPTTLIFKTPPTAGLGVTLQKLGGGAPLLVAKMPVGPGIYKIESGTRIVPEKDTKIEFVVDADVLPPGGDKDPFPPMPSPQAFQLAAASVVQSFFANTLGDGSFTAGDVDLDLQDVPPES